VHVDKLTKAVFALTLSVKSSVRLLFESSIMTAAGDNAGSTAATPEKKPAFAVSTIGLGPTLQETPRHPQRHPKTTSRRTPNAADDEAALRATARAGAASTIACNVRPPTFLSIIEEHPEIVEFATLAPRTPRATRELIFVPAAQRDETVMTVSRIPAAVT
jgi:hypothetical protein